MQQMNDEWRRFGWGGKLDGRIMEIFGREIGQIGKVINYRLSRMIGHLSVFAFFFPFGLRPFHPRFMYFFASNFWATCWSVPFPWWCPCVDIRSVQSIPHIASGQTEKRGVENARNCSNGFSGGKTYCLSIYIFTFNFFFLNLGLCLVLPTWKWQVPLLFIATVLPPPSIETTPFNRGSPFWMYSPMICRRNKEWKIGNSQK
jgi:hypothetical protein